LSAAATWSIDSWARRSGRTAAAEHFEPLTWAMYEMGRQQSASAYLLAVQVMQQMGRDIARFLVDHDVWLTPTLGEPPVPLNTLDSPSSNTMQSLGRVMSFIPFTPVCNVTGQPAMSVPLYWNSEGLPIGSHFVGRFGDEATLFRLAAQLEQARPWADRRPRVSAAPVSA
jgi:amidase